jgi:ATP-binding cassette, subfamily B, bacterial PglK
MQTIRKALRLIGPGQQLRWSALVGLALLSSGFEVLGAGLVFVLLSLVADPGGAVELPVVGDVTAALGGDRETLLLWLAVAMACFFLVRAVVHVGEVYAQQRLAHNAGARLAATMVEGYLTLPYSFHLSRNSADLIRNSHQAVRELVGQIFLPLIRVTANAILVIAMLGLLITISPLATALAFLIVGGSAVLMLRVVQPRLKRLGRRAHQLEREALKTLQQSFHGIRDVKVLGRERHFGKRYAQTRFGLARTSYLHSTATDLPKVTLELALLLFILSTFGAAILWGPGTEATLSVLGLFAYAGMRMQPSVQQIIKGLNSIKYASSPLDDIHDDLALIDRHGRREKEEGSLPFEREVRLEGVSFAYDGSDHRALDAVELTIEAGEIVGICGPTGGGKTTLVDVMTGLLPPTEGRVLVDGQPTLGREEAWQRQLGIVPQMVFLIDDTLRANIALGVRPGDVDQEALHAAIEAAQLAPLLDAMPDGLDTVVGERGVRISGGQRQRVAIARALYRRPRALIFDEGTSALDNETERELMAAVTALRGRCTVIMVAHRLSTVRKADRIFLVVGGVLEATGTYDELMGSSETFSRLVMAEEGEGSATTATMPVSRPEAR